MKSIKVLLACTLLLGNVVYAQEMARGVVYEDSNSNGKQDKNEPGVAHVAVSNGVEVVLTDHKGAYTIPVQNDNILFVIKPQGYSLPVDIDNHPQFYYIHKPVGSPELKYTGTKATGKLPKTVDFALLKNDEPTSFKALIFGDPQAYTLDEIDYFRKGVIEDITAKERFLFGVSLGDLVGDDLVLHQPYKKVIGSLGLPWFNVMGNHDMNYDVKVDSLSDETFEKNFGPNNYSFNYGNAHFIVLDNIIYPNPRTGKGYLGGFRKDQLDFVENDLKFVPKDKLIVLAFHIPLQHNNSDVFRNEDRQRLFDLLMDYPNTLSLSAHTHFQKQIFYGKEDGWKQQNPHHEYNVGTTSGDWYSGVFNEKGVPVSTMRDGTPKGYAILKVDNNSYTFDYKVAGKSPEYQINIIAPAEVKEKYVRRHNITANFFIGRPEDEVEYSLDGKTWKKMEYENIVDPSYAYAVLAYDNATDLVEGRKPSNPVESTHIWQAKFPKLDAGTYTISVRAKDMFGRTHIQQKQLTVVK